MRLPPHVIEALRTMQRRRDIPPKLYEMFEDLETLDLTLPIEEKARRWETAIAELRKYLR